MWTNTLFPFLYQTRTLRSLLRGNLEVILSRQLTHAATLHGRTEVPFWPGRGRVSQRRDTAGGRRRDKFENRPVLADRIRAFSSEKAGRYDQKEAGGFHERDAEGYDQKDAVGYEQEEIEGYDQEEAEGYDQEEAEGYDQKKSGVDDKDEALPEKRAQRNSREKGWHKAPKRDPNIPFELPSDLDVQEESEQVEVEVDNEETDEEKSTITPTERKTFEAIFEEIRDRREESAWKTSTWAAPNEDGKKRDSFVGSLSEPDPASARAADNTVMDDALRAQDTVNIIIKDAASRTVRQAPLKEQVPFEDVHAIGQTVNALDREKALLRFPPSLRKAARTVMNVFDPDVNKVNRQPAPAAARATTGQVDGLSEIGPGMASGEDGYGEEDVGSEFMRVDPTGLIDPLGPTIVSELARATERRRVEGELKKAENDFHLWELLEKHVFSMVEKLGIRHTEEETAAAREAEKAIKLRKLHKLAKSGKLGPLSKLVRAGKIPLGEPTPREPPGIPMDMTMHGPLYPGYLLFALRMMDQHFSRSSPLALAILPRVKELGMASYLLGASTSFYNVLMELHWRRYSDARAVLNLLEEMNYAGLYLDADTKSLVHRMEKDFRRYAGRPTDEREHNRGIASGKHPFLFELMQTPDYDVAIVSRLRHWSKTADISIVQRKRAMRPRHGFREDDDLPMLVGEDVVDGKIEY